MQRLVLPAILTVITFNTASAGPLSLSPPELPAGGASAYAQSYARPPLAPAPAQQVNSQNPNYGGGFFEMLFRGPAASRYEPNPVVTPQYDQRGYRQPFDPSGEPAQPAVSPRFLKQVV